MAFETNKRAWSGTATRGVDQALMDQGLRAYMLRVYNYMASGLALTGIMAVVIAQMSMVVNDAGQLVGLTETGQFLFASGFRWVVMLAPLAFVLVLSFGLHRMSFFTAQMTFWAFAAVMGVSLATIFIQFTGASVARVFFITSGTFAAMSLYGYTTKRDLSGMGSFLFMGLIGIIIASIVNMFMQSSALHFAISVIGVLVFVGLTAYDTQNIKNEYSEHHDEETTGKLAITGALRLYLDFINLFIMLMQLLGQRR
ncbi:MAG: BAX inhibitor (BI)-1/YccA family protein [Alphaproteobacteria bacterium]|nr:BAX inhibitor (BI)-1/YccA family protein [Alphaproteobacteria bacterium]